MASRFYLPSSAPAPMAVPVGSIWEETAANAIKSRLILGTPSGTPLDTDRTITKVTTGAQRDILAGQFVSSPLDSSGTLSGTFSYVGFHHFLSDRDAFVQARIAVVSGDGQTLRGEFYSGSTATAPSAVSTSPQYEILGATGVANAKTRIFNALAGSSVAYNAGDRIVFEIGYRDNVSNLTSPTTYFRFGDPASGTDLALAVDTAHNTTQRPWFELSQTLTFLTEADNFGLMTEVLGQADSVPLNMYGVDVEVLGETDPAPAQVYGTVVEVLGVISPPTSTIYSVITEAMGVPVAVQMVAYDLILEVMGKPPVPGIQDAARSSIIKVKGSDGDWYPLGIIPG